MRVYIKACVIALATFVVSACGGGDSFPEDARGAAEYYYQCLIDTNYNAYIDGALYSEALTPDLREERIDMLREYVDFERQARGGIVSAQAVRDDVVDDNAYVFMQICYGDSTSEEIMLPMAKDGERWKMK